MTVALWVTLVREVVVWAPLHVAVVPEREVPVGVPVRLTAPGVAAAVSP